jgi:hypothetical protein
MTFLKNSKVDIPAIAEMYKSLADTSLITNGLRQTHMRIIIKLEGLFNLRWASSEGEIWKNVAIDVANIVAFAKFPYFLMPFRGKIILNNCQTLHSATNICSLADIFSKCLVVVRGLVMRSSADRRKADRRAERPASYVA